MSARQIPLGVMKISIKCNVTLQLLCYCTTDSHQAYFSYFCRGRTQLMRLGSFSEMGRNELTTSWYIRSPVRRWRRGAPLRRTCVLRVWCWRRRYLCQKIKWVYKEEWQHCCWGVKSRNAARVCCLVWEKTGTDFSVSMPLFWSLTFL